jgi:hypothetical protein
MPVKTDLNQYNFSRKLRMKYVYGLIVMIGVSVFPITTFAIDYLFHVSCSSKKFVVEWKTGDVDPGREYSRFATGTKFPDCQISDYNPESDADLPRERYSHEGGIIAGIPFIGQVLCVIFDC